MSYDVETDEEFKEVCEGFRKMYHKDKGKGNYSMGGKETPKEIKDLEKADGTYDFAKYKKSKGKK